MADRVKLVLLAVAEDNPCAFIPDGTLMTADYVPREGNPAEMLLTVQSMGVAMLRGLAKEKSNG